MVFVYVVRHCWHKYPRTSSFNEGRLIISPKVKYLSRQNDIANRSNIKREWHSLNYKQFSCTITNSFLEFNIKRIDIS